MHSGTFPLHNRSVFTLLARAIRGNKLRRIKAAAAHAGPTLSAAAAAPLAVSAAAPRSLLVTLGQWTHFLGDSRLAWATAGQMSHSPRQADTSL